MDVRKMKIKKSYNKLKAFLCMLCAVTMFSTLAIKLSADITPQKILACATGVTYTEKETKKQEDVKTEQAPQTNTEITHANVQSIPMDFSADEIKVNPSDCNFDINIENYLQAPYPNNLKGEDFTKLNTDTKPLVLIFHTHATECYADNQNGDGSFRSRDINENMVSVGALMTGTLNSMGVPTIQCKTLHDAEDYNTSYIKSLKSVKYYLDTYPSIKYVFDVHRDYIERNGEIVKTSCTINGESSAQIMTLVGTNSQGANYDSWENHLNIAIKLQQKLVSNYKGLARPINLRGASFNQQFAPGALLFEIGSSGNTLAEAKTAAYALAVQLADMIKSAN